MDDLEAGLLSVEPDEQVAQAHLAAVLIELGLEDQIGAKAVSTDLLKQKRVKFVFAVLNGLL